MDEFRLFPESASDFAPSVDALYFGLIGVTVFYCVIIASLIVFFVAKYRRRPGNEVAYQIQGNVPLELFWITVPLLMSMGIFYWGARVYVDMARPPKDALEVLVVAKQWMWKTQHPSGRREIDGLHVPVGRPVKLVMSSQDVIHSFYVPAFRLKQDVLPGRYTSLWFTPTRTGRFHLFCAEYCGAQHSSMAGQVVVMDPPAYEAWLQDGIDAGSPAAAGEALYERLGCFVCHRADGGTRGPSLDRLYGTEVKLADGTVVTADESYLRESIVEPNEKITAGYEPTMRPYRLSAEEIEQIVAYLKSLSADSGDDEK